jgi:hypothetical protein
MNNALCAATNSKPSRRKTVLVSKAPPPRGNFGSALWNTNKRRPLHETM